MICHFHPLPNLSTQPCVSLLPASLPSWTLSFPSLLPTLIVLVFSAGLHNMGGDPVSVIHNIRSLLDIGRDRKNLREDYLGEF